jgi:hypothetical protein
MGDPMVPAGAPGPGAPPAAPTAPDVQSLIQQIMAAPEPVWRQLQTALKVKDRNEAAALVQSDPNAAATAQSILGQSVATKPGVAPAPSVPATAAALGGKVYPNQGGGKVAF